MVIQQGDLVWVSFPRARGSEPAGHRPALVLQSDAFNRSRINTVIVAAITSQLKYEALPGNVRLHKGEGGITKASVINMSQVHSIDRAFITKRIGSLGTEKFEQVKHGLRTVFGLESDAGPGRS